MGLGLVFWMFLLFSPLAWVGQAKADDTENYGTVIGIVSCASSACCSQLAVPTKPTAAELTSCSYRILELLTAVSV